MGRVKIVLKTRRDKMKFIIGIIVIAALTGGFFLFSTPVDESAVSQSEDNAVTYQSILGAVDEGAAFVDVRTPEEYYESHYEGAELFPLQRLQRGELPAYDNETPLYVYCRSGNRTKEASAILRQAGYEVIDLGGLDDVRAIGGQLTTDTCPLGEAELCVEQAAAAGNI